MIYGIGIDMIEIDRIATRVSAESGFRELVFSASEIEYCEMKTNKYEHYAVRFAAKEAFLKALGTGWAGENSFNEIEITNDQSGKPDLKLSGKTKDAFLRLIKGKISVSLSHLKSVAVAVVIIETL